MRTKKVLDKHIQHLFLGFIFSQVSYDFRGCSREVQ